MSILRVSRRSESHCCLNFLNYNSSKKNAEMQVVFSALSVLHVARGFVRRYTVKLRK